MLSRRLRQWFRRWSRPLGTYLALGAYLLAAIGYPLALPAARDTSTPFPCQDHHCGCHSADQCWSSCCCYSAEYRLAWARRHHVKIPQDAQVAMLAHPQEHSHHGSRACCQTETSDCHQSADHDCEKCAAPQQRSKFTWVHGFQAQKCRGITMLWVALGATLPPAANIRWPFDPADAGAVSIYSKQYSCFVSPPPEPPPRV